MGKYIVKKTPTGYNFALKATNGEVIATSEVYKTKMSCKLGIASVKANAPVAALEDQTVEDFKAERHPKFEVYTDKGEQYRFRLKAKNGQVVASSEAYVNKLNCLNGVESVRKNADSPVEEAE